MEDDLPKKPERRRSRESNVSNSMYSQLDSAFSMNYQKLVKDKTKLKVYLKDALHKKEVAESELEKTQKDLFEEIDKLTDSLQKAEDDRHHYSRKSKKLMALYKKALDDKKDTTLYDKKIGELADEKKRLEEQLQTINQNTRRINEQKDFEIGKLQNHIQRLTEESVFKINSLTDELTRYRNPRTDKYEREIQNLKGKVNFLETVISDQERDKEEYNKYYTDLCKKIVITLNNLSRKKN